MINRNKKKNVYQIFRCQISFFLVIKTYLKICKSFKIKYFPKKRKKGKKYKWLNQKFISTKITQHSIKYDCWERHPFPQKSIQDTSHLGLRVEQRATLFQCEKESLVFESNEKLKLNKTYKQEFSLTNNTEKELEIELYTVGFREPHEFLFEPNLCIKNIF